MKLALVTARQVDPWSTDDRLLCATLEARGQRFDWLAWDEPGARWRDYDRVLLRSCWDYHRHPAHFEAWLGELDAAGVRLVNSLDTVRRNMHKRYLLDLQASGVPVPGLRLVPRGSTAALAQLHAELGHGDLVVKPAISGSAWRTFRVGSDGHESAQREFGALAAERDVIVQAFVPEIQTVGEYSLMFFGGAYSHAVLKKPKSGEFRSQTEFGAAVAAVTPPRDVRAIAQQALEAFGTPAYARVDLVVSAGKPLIMEVELIEPVLFFRHHPEATVRMVEQLAA